VTHACSKTANWLARLVAEFEHVVRSFFHLSPSSCSHSSTARSRAVAIGTRLVMPFLGRFPTKCDYPSGLVDVAEPQCEHLAWRIPVSRAVRIIARRIAGAAFKSAASRPRRCGDGACCLRETIESAFQILDGTEFAVNIRGPTAQLRTARRV
jgi:hypothetical protein